MISSSTNWLRQVIDLRDTDKSRNLASSFDHRVCFFLMNILGKRSDLPFFMQEGSQEGEKHGFLYVCAEYYLQPNTVDGIAHEHTIICRQLFAGHVVGPRSMKKKKHLHRMIIDICHNILLPTFTR